VGVLDALRMYASCISLLAEVVALKCRLTCDNRCFEEAEALLTEDMANRRDMADIELEPTDKTETLKKWNINEQNQLIIAAMSVFVNMPHARPTSGGARIKFNPHVVGSIPEESI
jgi:hypothetical protein